MRVSTTLILLGASSASTIPITLRSSSNLISTITIRDTQDSGNNDNKITVVGIVIGSVIGVVLLAFLIAYLVSRDNCITRRGWFKQRQEKSRNKNRSQHLASPSDEESLTKRDSFNSDRESIMFSRSRASSLQFAVVEDVDDSQRRMSSQVYVLRGDKYIPLDQQESENKSLLSPDTSEMREVDSSPINNERASLMTIPVIISPPSETSSIDHHHDAASQVSAHSS